MTSDERRDLLELKAFLEKAIVTVDDQLIFTDPDVSKRDYDFLIDKVKMYRNNLEQILQLLQTDDDNQ
jgi:hypothetical protein